VCEDQQEAWGQLGKKGSDMVPGAVRDWVASMQVFEVLKILKKTKK
jgi:hypothetical protein